MDRISDNELFGFYQDTINRCGIYLLNKEDLFVEYNIYEEFDIGVHSFLHPENLDRLFKKGYISENQFQKSFLLYETFVALQKTKEWEFENFRTSEKWRQIMLLSDEIRNSK